MKHPVGINNAITAFIDGECHIFADTGSGSMSTTVHNTYDAYGNLASLTKPENHKGQRMRYDYIYDDVPMLETRVTDALGRHAESYTDEKGRDRETVQHASGDNITVTKNRFTKHYFIGDKRIASKLGTGKFSNVYGISGNNVTVGQKDYAARMMQIEKQCEEYYKSLGTPPGVPTMNGATADPDNTGRGYNDIIGDLGDHSVPEGWVQRPKFNDKGDVPGPPVQWQKPEDPDNAQPGYGYIPTDTTNIEDIFFYHSDHLGSTSYITDAKANITQFDAYLPYGELLVDEHTSSEDMPYKFNGKELDQETGLYYYGARYMNPVASIWYGVDPLTEKYITIGAYVYCAGNPIRLIDPDGKKIDLTNMSEQEKDRYTQQIKTERDASSLFNTIYTTLENSEDTYTVKFGQVLSNSSAGHEIDGSFTLNEEGGGTILLTNQKEEIASTVLAEELFHAYQHENRNNYEIGEFNREFEAKAFVTAFGIEKGIGFGFFPAMGDFQERIIGGAYEKDNQVISPEAVVSNTFLTDYFTAAEKYAQYNIRNNYGGSSYRKHTTVKPYGLQRAILDTYSKQKK